MTNSELLVQIKTALARGEVSPAELHSLLDESESSVAADRDTALIRILSYIGGAVIFLGVVFFVVLEWQSIPSVARVAVSLGGGLLAYSLAAVLFYLRHQAAYLPHTLSLIGLGLLPVGLLVTIQESGLYLTLTTVHILLSVVTAVFAAAAFFLLRRLSLFLMVTIVALTWLYFALAAWLMDSLLIGLDSHLFYVWVTIVAGAAYLLSARAVRAAGYRRVGYALEVLGVLAILVAALTGGEIWDSLYPLFLTAGFIGSVYLANQGVLILSSIFLVIYMIKITAVYFADTIGWPVALIGLGALIIAVSYGAYRLRYYVRSQTAARSES